MNCTWAAGQSDQRKKNNMLIGIHGVSGAGKDTLCDMITEVYPDTERRPEAEPVKEAAATFLGVDRALIEVAKNDPRITIAVLSPNGRPIKEVTMREFLRLIGHEGRRIFGEDIWLNLNFGRLQRNFHWNRLIVVTDVRYDNEAEAIRSYGGFNVHILRPGIERPNHGSEAGIRKDLIDYTINNDRGLDELRMATRTLLHDLETWPWGDAKSPNDRQLPVMH